MLLIPRYILWHYSRALLDLLGVWMNFLWFIYYFFSLRTLISTLLSPWKKLQDTHTASLNPADIVSSLFINVIMRFVGFAVRLPVIIIALGVLFLTLLLGIIFFIFWLLMPIVIGVLLIKGTGYLFG